jgi:hypothetical protein
MDFFWWYWNVRKFKNVSYPVKTLISSQKFRDISRNFVVFRDTKFREIKELFREKRNKYFAKFRDREISSAILYNAPRYD